MQVIISDNAEDNIREIYDYIATDSLHYAVKTANKIHSMIYYLEHSPYLGRYVPEIENKRYREILYKSYRIVYTISEETNTIYIHFVVHGKRNLKIFLNNYLNENNF